MTLGVVAAYGKSPYTLTPVVVPTYTLPFTIVGVSEVAGVAQPIPTPGSLVGIVEFLRNVGGIVSMQHRRETVIDGPDDAVVRAVGRDRRLELTLLWVRVVSVRF